FGAVGHDGRVLDKRHARAFPLDGARARANGTPHLVLSRRRREKQLFIAESLKRAATCQGTNTGTCTITESAKLNDGANCASSSIESVTRRASSSRARQSEQARTCALRGATPKPSSSSRRRSISVGRR